MSDESKQNIQKPVIHMVVLNDCQRGSTTLISHGCYPSSKDTFQGLCYGDCGRRGLLAFTLRDAAADWNRQTVAPETLRQRDQLLKLLRRWRPAYPKAEAKPC